MGNERGAAARMEAVDQREFERIRMEFSGKLFVPAESLTMDCTIVDLSAGGAGVLCADAPPLSTFVVLYVDGFGRFEGVTARYIEGVLGLRFQCGEPRRRRLVEKLNLYVRQGVTGKTRLRAHPRVPNVTALHFLRPSGEEIRCDVLDISLQGLSLKTKGRPPINEVIQIGKTFGRVARHHDQGIGVEFVAPESRRVFS